jgi:uncharacterized membrane protein YkvA (DUF1232 family)
MRQRRASAFKAWAKGVKRDVMALWIAARDPRTPWYAKAVAVAVAAYALSPIDLIPDFIPVLGYLDELVVLPLGIMLAVRLIPPKLMTEFRTEATRRESEAKSYVAGAVIVAIWLAVAVILVWAFWPRHTGVGAIYLPEIKEAG